MGEGAEGAWYRLNMEQVKTSFALSEAATRGAISGSYLLRALPQVLQGSTWGSAMAQDSWA